MIRKINSPNWSNRKSHAQDKTCETQDQSRVGTWIENDKRTDSHDKQERKYRYIERIIVLSRLRMLLTPTSGKSLTVCQTFLSIHI
jgi:hypothetical protein